MKHYTPVEGSRIAEAKDGPDTDPAIAGLAWEGKKLVAYTNHGRENVSIGKALLILARLEELDDLSYDTEARQRLLRRAAALA
jgi:hypothetical protein